MINLDLRFCTLRAVALLTVGLFVGASQLHAQGAVENSGPIAENVSVLTAAQTPPTSISASVGTALPTEQDPLTARREVGLAAQLRCLVCQNQSIAESNAELAQDLRRQIREQIAQGRSDTQIIDFMTARYGDFVLYNPPMKGTTLLLWLGPLLMLLGGAFAIRHIVRARASAAVVPLSADDKLRAEHLLAGSSTSRPSSTIASPSHTKGTR